ncbi:MAG: hypothetical protein QM537_02610 [Candidatus Symbiobacter sp.]|nr:hypothetical protein [Candidatus Symbiobacter sp.]
MIIINRRSAMAKKMRVVPAFLTIFVVFSLSGCAFIQKISSHLEANQIYAGPPVKCSITGDKVIFGNLEKTGPQLTACERTNYNSFILTKFYIEATPSTGESPNYYENFNRLVGRFVDYMGRIKTPPEIKPEPYASASESNILTGTNYAKCGGSEVECAAAGYGHVYGLHSGTEILFLGIKTERPMKVAKDSQGESTPRTQGFFYPGAGMIGWKGTKITTAEDSDYCGELGANATPPRGCFNYQYVRGGGDVFVHCYADSFGSKEFRNSCWRGFYVDKEVTCSGDLHNPFDPPYCRKEEGFIVAYNEPVSVPPKK